MHCGWRLGAVAGRPPHARGVLQPHRRAGGARQRTPGVLRGAAGGGVEARVRTARCGDLPQLQEVRHILTAKFEREFVSTASELRSRCHINAKVSTADKPLGAIPMTMFSTPR
jgi:hypothetical protein